MIRTLFIVLVLALLILFFIRDKVERDPLQKDFLTGTADPLPDGFYKGTSPSFSVGNWLGKEFKAEEKTGFNVFTRGGSRNLEYPFTMHVTKGARDEALSVIKIDYNRPENPWYLRFFAYDEIVRLSDGRYLGKIQIEVIRGVPFTIGWFWQEKE
ncbi:MAG: hypothetical protein V4674_00730 [Patescibacteria group bacterium]